MASTPFVPDPKYFGKDPGGICGLEMAEKAAGFSFGDADTVLIPFVVSGRPPVPSSSSTVAKLLWILRSTTVPRRRIEKLSFYLGVGYLGEEYLG